MIWTLRRVLERIILPVLATWLSLSVRNVFAGLSSPIAITAVVCVTGSLLPPNRPKLESGNGLAQPSGGSDPGCRVFPVLSRSELT